MRSKQRISFRLHLKLILSVLVAFSLVQPSAFATGHLKPDALPEYDEEKNASIVEINPPETFSNDYEITDSGELAKDKAAEMLERYPTLEANPYAILVRFSENASDDQVEDLLAQTGSKIVDFYPTVNWYLIETPRGNTNTQKIFGESYIVESVAIDSVIRSNSINTNDPLINDVWGLDSNHGVDASVAWPISQNASEVVVAVIDSGIDPNHPDLLDAIWINTGEIADNGIDDDNNGFIDDTYGWDFTGEYDNTPQDEHGHGTHVAGTIAATRNNAEGIAGVANNVKIMTLRFLDKQGNGITSWAINALEYAIANGAAISNNSWGGGPYETPLYNAIAQAGNVGHLFVAAAGNSGNNSDSFPMYPAAYNLPNILSVAAINSTGGLAGFSNYGINTVDIAAPGVSILSTMSGESENCPNPGTPCYVSWQGTSMAAPHAAGIAAIMLGVNNGLSPEEIIQIMQETVRPTSELNGKVRFEGELDGGAAVSVAASSGSINFIGYSPGQEIIQGSTISLSAVAVDSDGTDISENINWKDENDVVITIGDSITYTANTLGLLTLKAEVTNNAGDTFQKIAYFNVTGPSLIISSRDSILRASPGDTVNIEWNWEGPSNETQELNATTLNKYQVESTDQTNYLLPDDRTPVELTLNSTGSGAIVDAMVGIRINHSWPADLTMSLIHPDGTEVVLANHNGNGNHRDGSEVWGEGSQSCSGDLAYFADSATQSIVDRGKPFSGFSRPVESLGTLSGKPAAGEWTIRIVDGWAQDSGELFCAQLLLATSEPETTITINQQTDMDAAIANWELPDPFTFSGIYGFTFPQTSLGPEYGSCCVRIGLPSAPTDITASRTDSNITVSWSAAAMSILTDPISGYVVDAYRTTNSDINSGSCITENTSCTITDLLPGYEYDIVVRSVNNTGSSESVGYTVPIFENIFNQGNANLKDISESNDNFGAVIQVGDFNNDDNYDLIITAPNETTDSGLNEGTAHILYGFPSLDNNELLSRNNPEANNGDNAGFGKSSAVGDFNGDGYDDLIIGVPHEDVNSENDAGAIQIFYGSADGFPNLVTIHQDSPQIGGVAHEGDLFGASIATGDINADGYDDVVVGAPQDYYWPNERYCGKYSCGPVGSINVIFGSPSGLTGSDDRYFRQNSHRVGGRSWVGDLFGAAVAIGDINGDGYGDVVIGSPGDYYSPRARYCRKYSCGNVGSINVLFGFEGGVTTIDDQYIRQNSHQVAGRSWDGDRFGAAVAVGDIDVDGYADLVIGSPGDYYRPSSNYCRNQGSAACGHVGSINIIYGTQNGLYAGSRDRLITQNTKGVAEFSQKGDEFGFSLALGDLNDDGYLDLLVGAPGESINGLQGAGAAHILYGTSAGIQINGDELLHADQDTFTAASESDARFGEALLMIEGEIIIGSPGATIMGALNAGAIFYLSS